MQLKKLPIGIQTFSTIINENYVYVDKTGIAYNLIEKYRYVFLSRPRRFGKSLFVDTLRNIFEGKKELFTGLEILDKWNWDKKHPVIHITFSGGIKSIENINSVIKHILTVNQNRLDLSCKETDFLPNCFEELIHQAYNKYQEKVVILVDEYDKPILDNITDPTLANEMRDALTGLYSVIKTNDE